MDHFLIVSSSHPSFNAFRDDAFLQMMNDVAGDIDFKPLTIPHLKICVNAEHDAFKKSTRQAALDHQEEANENLFCQFVHDGATLLNKDKYQALVMQFADVKFRHNNVIISSFRKPSSHKAEKVDELAEEACTE